MDLIDAITKNNLERVQMILGQGVDLNHCDDLDGITPLHHAVTNSNLDIVFHLLSFGAKPDFIPKNGRESAIELACNLKKWDIVNLFVMSGKSLLVH